MHNKSWPAVHRTKRRTRGCSSSPALNLMACVKLWALRLIKRRKRFKPTFSPLPGPSGLNPVNNKSITTSCANQDSPAPDRSVQSNKRKSDDKIEDSPQKKAKSDDRPRKAKFKTNRHAQKSEQCDSGFHTACVEIDGPAEEDRENLKKDSTPPLVSGETILLPEQLFHSPTDLKITNCENKSPVQDKRDLPGNRNQRQQEIITTMYSDKDEFRQKYSWFTKMTEGGFGRVFAGFRKQDKKPVVLKCVLKRHIKYMDVEIDGVMHRVPDEVFYLMKVGAGPNASDCRVSPQLLDWYDLGREVGLVLERPEPCTDLYDYQARHRDNEISIDTAKTIFRQVVDSVSEIESQGIFHRDLKPENVLVETETDAPRAWIIDFGYATLFEPGETFRVRQGTAAYTSPEWLQQKMYTAEPTTVWQLGLTLFITLFHKRPMIETIASMRPITIPDTIPPDCRELLQGCLEKNPDDRLTLQDIKNHPWLRS